MKPEDDYGNEEYKLRLINKPQDRIEQLTTQMRFRMSEGGGECTYHIGVKDDGTMVGITDEEYIETMTYLDEIAKNNKYTITSIYQKEVSKGMNVYELLIREKNPNKYIDIKVAVAGNVDAGKCESKNTLVKLHSGKNIPIQNVEVNDLLMGDDGSARKVLETTKGYGQMYKIIPDDGDCIIVNKNHVLCFKSSNYNYTYYDKSRDSYGVRYMAYNNGLPKLITTFFPANKGGIIPKNMKLYESNKDACKDACVYLNWLNKSSKCIKYGDIVEITFEQYINLPESTQLSLKLYKVGIEYKYSEVPLDPYILGYCLGDSTKTDTLKYKDQEIMKYFENNLTQDDLLDKLIGDNKYIPDCYKYNSQKIRLSLLAGLIDSCGYLRHNCYDFCMSKKDRRLCDDMVEVIRSLGFASYPQYKIKINEKDTTEKYDCIQFQISGENMERFPILLDSKKAKQIQFSVNTLVTSIKDIQIVENQEYYGFELDGNGRYLHDDFTVTHNSSLLGVLTSGHLDDGRGKARTSILNYPHEHATGRTSSIAHHILGFDAKGGTVNNDRLGKMTWPEIVQRSEKVISFNDLCGHEKYLKTTILGLSSTFPDLCFIIVGANMGLTRMTKEHIFLCLTLKIPFVVIITKMDIVKDRKNVYDDTMDKLHTLLKMPSIRRAPYKVKNNDDVLLCAEKIYHDTLTPIFHISNVTGEGINELKMFLNLTKKRRRDYRDDEPVEYHIDTIFKNVKGVGVVVGGNLITGTLRIGDKLLLGPINGKFENVLVRSLQCKRVPIDKVDFSSYVCIGVRNIDKDRLRKGQVIISPKSKPISATVFKAEIKILKSHSTTVREGYEPILHTCSIRQSATLVRVLRKDSDRNEEGKEHILRVGDKGLVLFKFKYRSEFVKPGYRLFLSEGKTKAIGEVVEVIA